MKEKLKAIEVNLRTLLQRVEKLEVGLLSYQVIEKVKKIELKVDEMGDLVTEVEGICDDDV